ncbi:hypothetical protein GCK72_021040 [Caenorhabditis remanei]|uniref:F-box domain-containing protein n=1 Tax=Caenorhabditis remanei TaxID=31234 RepID=A0A6A5GGX1_CAERE|nr:hypothetical protein GCK72_021040 [Caenorhabditis remanei]KAF1754477.1 hypothetical protein GCK72_021040 [Caenorhabditis remanei]
MTGLPPDSPIDIRALVLYDAHKSKTVENSYKNYEKLCEVLRKEAMPNEEYEFYFNQYLKEANFPTKNEERDPPVTDIRYCILSDVINGKSVDGSYTELCESFGSIEIDKSDHGYWYQRYKDKRHPSTPPEFSNLPYDVVEKIVEECDLFSIVNLRKVSHSLKNVIEHSKPPCADIRIECLEDWVSLHCDKEVTSVFSGPNAEDEYSELCNHDDNVKKIFDALKLAFHNPKLRLNSLDVQTFNYCGEKISRPKKKNERNQKMFNYLFNSLNHKIHVEHCLISSKTTEDAITVLKSLKPGVLEKLSLCGSNKVSNIDRLVEMEQWKQAEHLVITREVPTSIEYFGHFKTFVIEFRFFTADYLVELVDLVSNSSKFESCTIIITPRIYEETIKEVLNLQRNAFPEIYSIPNSNLVLEFMHETNYFRDLANKIKITVQVK